MEIFNSKDCIPENLDSDNESPKSDEFSDEEKKIYEFIQCYLVS